eukprot:6194718-Pleurochrysis_carterae.AAC.1
MDQNTCCSGAHKSLMVQQSCCDSFAATCQGSLMAELGAHRSIQCMATQLRTTNAQLACACA